MYSYFSGSTLEISLLVQTQDSIQLLLNQFQTSEDLANKTLASAQQLDNVVDSAQSAYASIADTTYLTLGITNAVAAAADAAAATTFAAASVDGSATFFSGGGNITAIATVGAANAVVQATAAGLQVLAERELDLAGKTYESALQKADNALTVLQAQDQVQDLLREKWGTIVQQQELQTGLQMAQARRKALLLEIDRIRRTLDTNTQAVRSRFYADPIHFIRSRNAILDADAAFEEAQRWMFYAQRALEHKWTQRFGVVSVGQDYDSGALFRMRNAAELDDLLTAFLNFDANRELGDVQTAPLTSVISLRDHLLARNPNRLRVTDTADSGLRLDPATGQAIPVEQYFRDRLRGYQDVDGNIVIPINTALLQDINGLFRGPSYGSTGTINAAGQWRDKVLYVKVNIVAEGGPIPGPGGQQPKIVNGSISYGGLTLFRTRVVPCPSNSLLLGSSAQKVLFSDGTEQILDVPGEFFAQPYRYYQNENLDNVFTTRSSLQATASFAYSGQSVTVSYSDPTLEDPLGSSFQVNDFRELSVAATGWLLTILADQPNQAVNIDAIKDIELLIRHQASSRIIPASCP